ncbi:MAG: fumarylacetoacetate hydrolase family protein [Rhodospirillales bacterium]|nr:fumarylacetoacetate hydrolase family protein [Rhodospirillales bacterium]
MKLVTFEVPSPAGPLRRIGAQSGDNIVDLNLAYAAYLQASGRTDRAREIADAMIPADMIEFFKGGELGRDAAEQALDFAASDAGADLPLAHEPEDVTLLAPVPRPRSIRDTISFETHAKNFEKRSGKPTPDLWYERPIYYKGNCDTVIGPGEDIVWPAYTEKLDYELEFGIYIGKTGKNIPAGEAGDHIAGYTIFNDISARDALQSEITMMLGPAKGKDMDTGNIFGPCVVTPDEIDAGNLKMEARINGEVWSEGNSSDMYWSFPQIIEFISQDETLHPGDFIGSGTIAFGCGDELDRWIQRGDVIELEVEGIGVLRNQVAK